MPLCSVITQEAGIEEFLWLCLATLSKLQWEREPVLFSRLALPTTLILDREQVWLLGCLKAFKNMGSAILVPTQPVSQGCPAGAIMQRQHRKVGETKCFTLITISEHKVISTKPVLLTSEEMLQFTHNLNGAWWRREDQQLIQWRAVTQRAEHGIDLVIWLSKLYWKWVLYDSGCIISRTLSPSWIFLKSLLWGPSGRQGLAVDPARNSPSP